ncbi:helix-turn-helix domain-containing protein [Aeribacillus pallidus]|uniref:helix-turn-helix domain-containing protein n=1 Tax=Aeribacillus TaxID=1055323 RepID=UPI0007B4AF4F|nr:MULTISPECIES: helix-turn-helix domain-containing protein [Aeribacillus]KZM54943.1 transcriptional regulator [Aeribacillus pallidus]MED0649737.1 helix-turn-helix domain-containing protein [Aeribacillus composti]MED4488540.1 helix-turn-helix domain-containing protein [Aeribacillus pallidus]
MFGKRLASLRKKMGISQYELADRLGFSRGQLANYEQGKRQPDFDTLQKIADFFEVSTDYLLGRSENKKSDWDSKLPELTEKDERDIAKQLEKILDSMDSGTALAFDGEPLDEETKELVRAAIESNLRLTKQLAKQKFTPKKYRKDQE